jgi:hypothetical protein
LTHDLKEFVLTIADNLTFRNELVAPFKMLAQFITTGIAIIDRRVVLDFALKYIKHVVTDAHEDFFFVTISRLDPH